MPYRRFLLVLVPGLAVLVVSFAVLMAFQTLFSALGDLLVARILGGIALGCLVILVVDVLLLVSVLGVLAVRDADEDRGPRDGQRD